MGTFNDGDSGSSIRTKINTAIQKTEGTSAISTIDVDGGAIDGVTLGTNSAVTEAQVDNININGNAITSTDTNGNIVLTPNGSGEVDISKVDIDAGAIDGVTIGTNSAVTDLRVDNLQLDGNTVSSTNLNGDVNISPNGTGTVVINTDLDVDNINVNGNTISSTDTNGDVTIDPNGTGDVNIGNFKFDADQTVGAGQDNYVLTYDNAGGKISLEAAAGGGGGDMTLISTTNITSAVASVDISLSSSYAVQVMVIHNLDFSSGTRLRYRVSDDNGTTFESTSSYFSIGEFRYIAAGAENSGVLTNGGNSLQSSGLITRLIYGFDDLSSRTIIYNSQNSSAGITLQTDSAGGTSSAINYADCASTYISNSTITDIRLFSDTGNLTQGVIKLYGLS